MENVLIILLVAAIIAGIVIYLIRAESAARNALAARMPNNAAANARDMLARIILLSDKTMTASFGGICVPSAHSPFSGKRLANLTMEMIYMTDVIVLAILPSLLL